MTSKAVLSQTTAEPLDGDAEYDGSKTSDYTAQEVRRITRKIDWRLITIAGLMYTISLLDRTNLGAALIAGMREDLGLSVGTRYSVVSLVFFVTYVLFQPPATLAIRFFGPRLFLGTICILWGGVILGAGFSQDWTQLVACRVLLGVFEAGLFPGIVYLLSTWYTRYDLARRYGLFYLFGMISNAFGGILAFGFGHMEGVGHLRGWRWIFIMEGIITLILGTIGLFFLLGFPDRNPYSIAGPFLTDQELEFVLLRNEMDKGDARPEKFNLAKWASSGLDFKVWIWALLYLAVAGIGYSLSYFLPVILNNGMGFDVGTALCLTAPPYVFSASTMILVSWLSDKTRHRGIFIIISAVSGIIGLSVLGFSRIVGVRYFGVFLACASANNGIPLIMAYQANNIRGQWKRAFCSATLIGAGGVGGIMGSLVFRSQDAPNYVPGLAVSIGLNVMVIVLVVVLNVHFYFQNKQQEAGKILEGLQGFRYTY